MLVTSNCQRVKANDAKISQYLRIKSSQPDPHELVTHHLSVFSLASFSIVARAVEFQSFN